MNIRHHFSSLFENISLLFLVIVSIFSMFSLYSRFTHGQSVRILSVVSGSMSPYIRVGSAVIVFPQSEYVDEDVITYKLGKNLVTHRIVYAGNYYLTKGDANKEIDTQTVSRAQIVGKVHFIVPLVGYIQESTKNIFGLIAFVWFPSLIIVGHESLRVMKEFQRINFSFGNINKSSLLVFIFLCSSFAYLHSAVFAYYSSNNQLSAIVSTGVFATPQPTETPLPPVTPTATPASSSSPAPCPLIGNCNNGAGSINIINVNNSSTTEINQTNNSSVTNSVNLNVQTGNNTGTTVSTQTGSTVLQIQTNTSTNTNVFESNSN